MQQQNIPPVCWSEILVYWFISVKLTFIMKLFDTKLNKDTAERRRFPEFELWCLTWRPVLCIRDVILCFMDKLVIKTYMKHYIQLFQRRWTQILQFYYFFSRIRSSPVSREEAVKTGFWLTQPPFMCAASAVAQISGNIWEFSESAYDFMSFCQCCNHVFGNSSSLKTSFGTKSKGLPLYITQTLFRTQDLCHHCLFSIHGILNPILQNFFSLISVWTWTKNKPGQYEPKCWCLMTWHHERFPEGIHCAQLEKW